MSKHVLSADDLSGRLGLLGPLREKARTRTGRRFEIILIQEAGLDGY